MSGIIQATNLQVDNIKHSGGTSAMTINSSGFVLPKIPAFRAELSSSQTINQSTWTQVHFATEVLDNAGWYNTSSYRYTPQEAGWYLFTLNLFQGKGTGNSTRRIGAIGKNGAHQRVWDAVITSSDDKLSNGSILLHANGSSDYFEAYSWVQTSNSSDVLMSDGDYTNFSGFLVTTA